MPRQYLPTGPNHFLSRFVRLVVEVVVVVVVVVVIVVVVVVVVVPCHFKESPK